MFKLRKREPDFVVLRAATPQEKRSNLIFAVIAIIYSAAFLLAAGLGFWRDFTTLFK